MGIMGVFWFKGKSCAEFGIHVSEYPDQNSPERNVTILEIPGRNGTLTIDNGNFKNITRTYSTYFNSVRSGTPASSRAIKEWLLIEPGYHRLTDEYEPDYFRLARFTGPLNIDSFFDLYGRCDISFDCAPQKYRFSGQESKPILTTGQRLNNPEAFPSKPIITIYGKGDGTLLCGNQIIKITGIDEYITLDSETQNAYKGLKNQNTSIDLAVFPELAPGDTAFSWTGGITKIEVTPRWWTI